MIDRSAATITVAAARHGRGEPSVSAARDNAASACRVRLASGGDEVMGKRMWLVRCVLSALVAVVALGGATSVTAQQLPILQPPVARAPDPNGVDLLSLAASVQTPSVSIGDPSAGGLSYSASYALGPLGVVSNAYSQSTLSMGGTAVVSLDGVSEEFVSYTPIRGTGSSLQGDSLTGELTYTKSDGTVAIYKSTFGGMLLSKVTRPNGDVTEYTYQDASYQCGDYPPAYCSQSRLSSIITNRGYQLKFEYASTTGGSTWLDVTRVIAINNAVEYCPPAENTCTLTGNWPSLSFSYVNSDAFDMTKEVAVTDPVGSVYKYKLYQAYSPFVYENPSITTRYIYKIEVKYPGSSVPDLIYNGGFVLDSAFIQYHVTTSSVVTPAGAWTYSASDSEAGVHERPDCDWVSYACWYFDRTVTVTDPLAHTRSYRAKGEVFYGWPSPLLPYGKYLVSATDPLSKTTNYGYDPLGRLTSVANPEGDVASYTYDDRGNVKTKTLTPRTGSSDLPIYWSAGYDPCTTATRFACNKPRWVMGPTHTEPSTTPPDTVLRTNFDYDTDSTTNRITMVTVTAPEPTSGAARPQVKTTYEGMVASYYRDSSGGISSDPEPTAKIYLPTLISQCTTSSSCADTAAERVVTSTVYGANNLLPTEMTQRSGDSVTSATTTFIYDDMRNKLSEDGPLPGPADTTRYRYDAMHRVVGVVGPDPDGPTSGATGLLKPRAVRNTYNPRGLLKSVETGTVNTQTDIDTWSNFTVLKSTFNDYDANNRRIISKAIDGDLSGVVQSVVQYSYDADSRLECMAVRMNRAAFSTIAATGACDLGPTGSDGPDRITKKAFDAADQLLVVTSALRTSLEQATSTTTYSDNGKPTSITDANGNVTAYGYDGFDRLVKTRYPCPTTGVACSTGDAFPKSSLTDFESLELDAAGNVTKRTLRRKPTEPVSEITYTYDALNRETVGMLGVTTGYDNLNRIKSRTYGGQTITFGYDALGRQTSETNPYGAVSRTFDAAGRRQTMTAPGGYSVDYQYLVTGEVKAVNYGVSYEYDDLGRRVSLTRANGVKTTYTYDAASTLQQFQLDQNGTAYDQTVTFNRNAVGQILGKLGGKSVFEPTPRPSGSIGSAVNGLNQLTSSDTFTLSYDGRGNLIGDGINTYGYDLANRLTSTYGRTLSYDGMGRLAQISDGTTTTNFVYDGSNLIEEFNGTGPGTLTAEYVHGAGTDEPVVWWDLTTNIRKWFAADERSSIISITNDSGDPATIGSVIGINAYDEYGVPKDSNVGRFQYTGQIWLPELKLYYYKARVYSPKLGRFLQTDPIGMKDDLNLYAYVMDDPINKVDSTGLEGENGQAPTPTELRSTSWLCQHDETACSVYYPAETGSLVSRYKGVDNMPIGRSNVGEASNVLTNESRDLTGGRPGELEEAKNAQANAIINGLLKANPPDMAPSILSRGAAESAGRGDDQRIMRQAYLDRLAGLPDPVAGRVFFGNSANDITSRPIGNGRQTVYLKFGPFTHGNGSPQYIYIYNNPELTRK